MSDRDQAIRRAQAAALEPWLGLSGDRYGGALEVLLIGPDAGRWRSELDPAAASFVVETPGEAASDGDTGDAEALSLDFGDESFHLALGIGSLSRYDPAGKRALLAEIWRVTRSGGRMLLLEDLVFAGGAKTGHHVSAKELESLLFEATAGRVVLEHVQALRYPGEDLHTAGLISLTRLSPGGGPEDEERRMRPASGWPALSLDGPVVGQPLTGWAYSPAGIREIAIWLDERRSDHVRRGLKRPDAAERFPGAMLGGFWHPVLDAQVLPTEITVVAKDWLGRRAEIRNTIRPDAPGPVNGGPGMNGSLDIPKWRDGGDPLKEAGWSGTIPVHGWAVDPEGIESIEILLDGEVVERAEHGFMREDVHALLPDLRSRGLTAGAGWWAVLPTEGITPGEHVLTARVHGASGTLGLGPRNFWVSGGDVREDEDRRERLEGILRCPECGGGVERHGGGLRCERCGHEIPRGEHGSLLVEEAYAGVDWRQAGSTNHGYPPEAIEVIRANEGGLVLDVGAGLREGLPQVIQLDALAFPNLDVVADAGRLPFADESFDGVIACNLLEHVPEPERVVREIRRVCKVGGRIYADWTSVHPYHGFPHHYTNATVTGMERVMREVGGAAGTVHSADGRVTVSLILDAWLNSLEDAGVRERLQQMPLGRLMRVLRNPDGHPELHRALGDVSEEGRRIVPPKVTFTGVRER